MEFVLDNAAVTLSTVRTLTGTTKLLHWSLTDMVAMRNQFPDPETWPDKSGSTERSTLGSSQR